MIDDTGNNIDLASPSTPVEILGIDKSALAGDDFIVVETEDKAKEKECIQTRGNFMRWLNDHADQQRYSFFSTYEKLKQFLGEEDDS